ncbi:MAG: arginine N-succinyltransferase, partial [Pirellula sp.]
IHNGPTEIGGLFLAPAYRGRGCGKLLSLSRFAYMAAHPKRFATQTIAEMRGNIDGVGASPFWDAIGAHFFKIDFPLADSLSMVDKQFIEDLMPRYPIYLDLLPRSAVDCIGHVHEQTEPALAMLRAQGFECNGLIDIFDGGPVVECKTQEIVAVRDARHLQLVCQSELQGNESAQTISRAIVSTSRSPFVSIQCEAIATDNSIAIHESSLAALQASVSDAVWLIE